MIIKTEFWNDIGFLESSYEVPSLTAVLPEPDFEYDQPLHPATDRLFSEIQLPEAWSELLNISYVRVTYEFNNSETQTFCGWVDSVSLKSDTDGYPVTVINWHIDFWRTYASRAVFGAGLVKRAKPSVMGSIPVPPQTEFSAISWGRDSGTRSSKAIFNNNGVWWVYFTYTAERGTDADTTETDICCFPVAPTSGTMKIAKTGGTVYETVQFPEVLTGSWDEAFNLTPSRIKAAFLSPYPPILKDTTVNVNTSSGEITVYIDSDAWAVTAHNSATKRYFTARSYAGENPFQPSVVTVGTISTDTQRTVLTDCEGNVFGEIPWNRSIDRFSVKTVMTTVAGYVQFNWTSAELDSPAIQTSFTMPMIPIEVTSNSYSEYNYTGARESDIQQRRLQSEKAAISTIFGNTMSGTQMGVAGGMEAAVDSATGWNMDAKRSTFSPRSFGSAIGGSAGVGALVGAVTGVAAGVTTRALDEYLWNPEDDRVTNFANARATDPLITAGSGFDALFMQRTPRLLTLTMDHNTLNRRTNYLNQYGFLLDIQLENCTPVIQAGGGVRIVNLNVTGDIPKQAKEYIRNRLANGVHIK